MAKINRKLTYYRLEQLPGIKKKLFNVRKLLLADIKTMK